MPQAIYLEQRYQYTNKPRCRYFAIQPGLSQTSSTIHVDLAGHVATCSPPNSQHTQTITWPNIEAWQHQGTEHFHDPVCSCDPSTNANGISFVQSDCRCLEESQTRSPCPDTCIRPLPPPSSHSSTRPSASEHGLVARFALCDVVVVAAARILQRVIAFGLLHPHLCQSRGEVHQEIV